MGLETIHFPNGRHLVDHPDVLCEESGQTYLTEVGPGLEAPQILPSMGRTLSRPTLFDSFSLLCYSPRELADQLESRT